MKLKLAMLSLLLVCLAGCQPDPPLDSKNRKPEVQLTSPITGTKVSEAVSKPVIMVMINNHAHARPQSGLHLADVVVEILAEGEISRFAAFYYDHQEGVVGPVRSVRDYYLDLAEGAGAVVAHAGGSPSALDRIRRENSPSIDGVHQDEKYFTRVSFRKSPHNLYADLDVLKQVAAEKNFPDYDGKQAYRFSGSAATAQGQPAEKVDLIYHKLYKAGYQYDRASKAYIRYTEGEQQIDRETKTPLSMQNVLVVFAKHQVIDYVGHRDVKITGSGKGYLLQQGKAAAIEWKFRNGWIVPYSNGKEITLLPGKTWVNVLPETGKVFFQ